METLGLFGHNLSNVLLLERANIELNLNCGGKETHLYIIKAAMRMRMARMVRTPPIT